MPVQRKQQVLAKIEISEGVSSSPGSGDAVQVFDPAISDNVEQQDRVPAGPTLSRDFTPIGRKTRQITFRSDLRGNNDVTIPIAEPDWGRFVQACGYATTTLKKVTMGAVTGTGFQIGEIISQSSGAIRGVVLGAFTSGGVLVERLNTSGGHLAVAVIVGTFTAAATTAESSASTATASAVADYEGICYQPTSLKLVNVETGAWSVGDPALGEVLAVEDVTTSVRLGSVMVIINNGSFTDMDVTLLWGSMGNGNRLRTAAGTSVATISAPPTQVKTPSLTVRHNLDGRQRDLLGARGDFNVEGSVGEPMQFSWTFSGDLGTALDTPPVTTTGLSTVRPPRLLGAMCIYGHGAEISRLPTKRVGLANAGTVNPNLDANRPGGATGSNVTDRDPAFSVTTDAVHSAFDWEALRDAGTVVRVAIVVGNTKGNICALVSPVGQVTEVNLSDSDGIATMDVTIKPRRIRESGDDEVYIAQL